MLILGLTGGIATGKSSVSRIFKEEGIPVVDADEIARKIVQPFSKIWCKLVHEFGTDIINPLNNEVDRKKLGNIVFSDEKARKKLNSIMHPAIVSEIIKQALKHYLCGEAMVILDIPLLFETGFSNYVSKTAVVYCDEDMQRTRLMKRDLIDASLATLRMNSQMSLEEKCKKADFIIDNSGNLSETEERVKVFIHQLRPSKLTTIFWWSFPYILLSFCSGTIFLLRK